MRTAKSEKLDFVIQSLFILTYFLAEAQKTNEGAEKDTRKKYYHRYIEWTYDRPKESEREIGKTYNMNV